jgi:hypothetical protein
MVTTPAAAKVWVAACRRSRNPTMRMITIAEVDGR